MATVIPYTDTDAYMHGTLNVVTQHGQFVTHTCSIYVAITTQIWCLCDDYIAGLSGKDILIQILPIK